MFYELLGERWLFLGGNGAIRRQSINCPKLEQSIDCQLGLLTNSDSLELNFYLKKSAGKNLFTLSEI